MKHFYAILRLVVAVSGAGLLMLAACGEESTVGPDEKVTPSGPDTIPPAAINSLIVQVATKSTLALQWISPGDDGDTGMASAYDIRYHTSEITDLNWDGATPVEPPPDPQTAGSVEILVVKGLFSSTTYYFCIKTTDDAGNRSGLSNCAHGTTLAEYIAPARITDLFAQAVSDSEFLLTWTATGDDGVAGTASVYDIRYSDSEITPATFGSATRVPGEPDPKPAGEPDSMLVGGFSPDLNYYFAMRAGDEVPNWSMVSNTTMGLASSVYFMVFPTIITNTDNPVTILFRSDSAAQDVVLTIDILTYAGGGEFVWVVARHLVEGRFEPGVHQTEWDFRNDDGQMIMGSYQQIMVRFYLDNTLIGEQALRRG